MKPIVRKATLNDLSILLKFEQGLIAAERPMDPSIMDGSINYYDISELINKDDSDVFVVEIKSEIVASGYVKIKQDRHYSKNQNMGYLGFMFVPKVHRGNGYNQHLVEALIAWCHKRKIYEIRLDVYTNNPAAIRAYEKAGFSGYLLNMKYQKDN